MLSGSERKKMIFQRPEAVIVIVVAGKSDFRLTLSHFLYKRGDICYYYVDTAAGREK